MGAVPQCQCLVSTLKRYFRPPSTVSQVPDGPATVAVELLGHQPINQLDCLGTGFFLPPTT